MTTKIKMSCELCKIKVDNVSFTLHTASGPKAFCCIGCKSIYEMLQSLELMRLALFVTNSMIYTRSMLR